MEPFTWVVAGLTGFAAWIAVTTNRAGAARLRDWVAAAAACGLHDVGATKALAWRRQLQATRGPLRIRLRAYTGAHGTTGTRIVVHGLQRHLQVVHRSGSDFEVSGLATGDDAFDRRLRVFGDLIPVLAVMDGETRRRLRALFADRVSADGMLRRRTGIGIALGGQSIVAECSDEAEGTRAQRIADLLEEMLAVAERLMDPSSVEERLAANAQSDPLPSVRLRSLRVLLAERPDHPATRATLEAALDDPDEEVCLAAAFEAGEAGRETLARIARDETTNDIGTARALVAVGDAFAGDDLERILSASLRLDKERTMEACLELLGRRGETHVAHLLDVLADSTGTRALAAVRALGLSGTVAAEPALLRAVMGADLDLSRQAASSLGALGTAASVVVLREAEADRGWDRAWRAAAREAIASIQSRLVGADRGQLALAAGAGEISLVEEASGRLSRPDEPAI